jgi:hypothetical protein
MLCMEDSMKRTPEENVVEAKRRMAAIENRHSSVLLDLIEEYMGQVPQDQRLAWKNKIHANTEGEKQVRSLAAILYDGLAYGNWPWSARTVTGILSGAKSVPPKGWDKV